MGDRNGDHGGGGDGSLRLFFRSVPDLKSLLDEAPSASGLRSQLAAHWRHCESLTAQNAQLKAALAAGGLGLADPAACVCVASRKVDGLSVVVVAETAEELGQDRLEAATERLATDLSGPDPNCFVLDTAPLEDVAAETAEGRGASYTSAVRGHLGEDVPKVAEARGPLCWNCSQPGHAIAACPEPRNQAEINKNRAAMGTPNRAADPRFRGENARKWAAFVPGALSDELRDALGLRRDDLPPWIYAMRSLGYPPGHLKGAVDKSPALDFAEGRQDDGKPRQLALDDIHAFPGFNEPAPRDARDEARRGRGFLAFCKEQRRELLLTSTNETLIRQAPPPQLVPPPPPPPDSPEAEASDDVDVSAIPLQSEAESALNGQSAGSLPGTPLGLPQQGSTPSLRAFSAGIVPFSAEEADPSDPTAKRGNFATIKASLAQLKAALADDADMEAGQVD